MNIIEPILAENKDRFVIFPIKHKEIWKLYKDIEHRFFVPDIKIFQPDTKDFKEHLTDAERDFLAKATAALVLKHKIFGENSLHRFLNEVQYPEARFFYGFSEMMSNIYQEVSSYIASLLCNETEAQKYVVKLMESSVIKDMLSWIDINYTQNKSFASRLIAYACFKRIIFSGLIAGITSFRLKEKMSAMVMLMNFIFEDEGLYTDFALTVYAHLDNKEKPTDVTKMIQEVAELENSFMQYFNDSFSTKLLQYKQTCAFTSFISVSIEETVLNSTTKVKQPNPFNFIDWKRSFVLIDKNKVEKVMDRTIRFDADF
jgi:ribonucleotide reductase beta subunit family protein with ferritin-like domain